jgi:hypothetical protein
MGPNLRFDEWVRDLAAPAAYFILSQIKVRVPFTPSRVVVLKEMVSLSPVIVKWRSMAKSFKEIVKRS